MENRYLRLYTSLPSLLHMLGSKQLTLLDPESWDDKNDRYYLSEYKKKKNLKTLLALCFSEAGERYQHWRVFANGSSGICVVFNKNEIVSNLTSLSGVTSKEVDYKELKEIESKSWQLKDLPFVKRWAFRDEKEYRIIYEDKDNRLDSYNVKFEMGNIEKVVISPWMHKDVFESVKKVIKDHAGYNKLVITKSNVLESRRWQKACSKFT